MALKGKYFNINWNQNWKRIVEWLFPTLFFFFFGQVGPKGQRMSDKKKNHKRESATFAKSL